MRRACLLAIVVACRGAAPAEPPPRPPPGAPAAAAPAPPDLARLRALLAPHAARGFDAGARDRGCPADQTLGAYVAMLVAYGTGTDPDASPDDTHRLVGGCGGFPAAPIPIDPPADPGYWFCTIDSSTVDAAGESPWHYELRLRVRRADGAPDLTTLACPGTA